MARIPSDIADAVAEAQARQRASASATSSATDSPQALANDADLSGAFASAGVPQHEGGRVASPATLDESGAPAPVEQAVEQLPGGLPFSSYGDNSQAAGETNASPEPTPAAETGQPTSARTPGSPWYSHVHLEAAQSRGLTELDLRSFQSEGQFLKAIQTSDAIMARRLSQAPPQQAAAPAAPAPQVRDEDVDAPVLPDGRLNVAYYKNRGDIDESIIAGFQATRDMQDRELERNKELVELREKSKQSEEVVKQMAVTREINEFHDALDKLDPEFYGVSVDKYGTPGEFSEEQYQRRATAFDLAGWMRNNQALEQQAKGLPIAYARMSFLAEQASSRCHGSERQTLKQNRHKAGVSRLAAEIRPSSGSVDGNSSYRAPAPVRSDNSRDLAKVPEVRDAWAKAGVNH